MLNCASPDSQPYLGVPLLPLWSLGLASSPVVEPAVGFGAVTEPQLAGRDRGGWGCGEQSKGGLAGAAAA